MQPPARRMTKRRGGNGENLPFGDYSLETDLILVRVRAMSSCIDVDNESQIAVVVQY
jgi:hypothetical protein